MTIEILKKIDEPAAPWSGRVAGNWSTHVGFVSKKLAPTHLSRKQVFEFCSDSNNSSEECVATVCAWGGMKVGAGRRLFAENIRRRWSPLVDSLRHTSASRSGIYDEFAKLRKSGGLVGCGPAHFTKLIFFMNPDVRGYIMDQWTSKSIQLIVGCNRPWIYRGRVTDQNSGEDYEFFCDRIEHIAQQVSLSPPMLEEKLFSNGGRNPGVWRRYVVQNWN